jgi:hypothetical protein
MSSAAGLDQMLCAADLGRCYYDSHQQRRGLSIPNMIQRNGQEGSGEGKFSGPVTETR